MTQEVSDTGIMPIPSYYELAGYPVGGHEVVVVGYEPGYLIVLNSWGSYWGLNGFFKMPVEYLTLNYKWTTCVQQILILRPVPLS